MASAQGPVEKRGREKWSREDNLDVMRCFFKATTPDLPVREYVKRMHQEWSRLRPDRPVSEQRLSDQYRFVKRSKKFSLTELDELLSELTPQGENTEDINQEPASVEGADNESAAEHVILAAPDGCFAADSFSTQNGVAVGDSETGESTATGDEFEIAGEAEDLKEVADTLLDSYHKWRKVPVPDRPLISTLRQVKHKRLAKVSNHVDKALKSSDAFGWTYR